MTSTMPDTLETMPTPMEVEEHHRPFAEEPGGLQLAIDSTFSVEEEDAGVLEIKQEPEDYVQEPDIPIEDELFEGEEITDHNLAQVYPEINVSILQRAVSPPSMYNDLDEESFEELKLYYNKIYDLKEVSVTLESCDKIWETLQLIKNIQGDSHEDQNFSCTPASPKNSSESQIGLSGLLNTIAPRARKAYNTLPEYRFSLKNKRKVFHCMTCNKIYASSQSLKDHAKVTHGVFYNPKRIYKIRTDFVPHKILPAGGIKNELEMIQNQELPPSAAIKPVQTINQQPELLQPIVTSNLIQQTKNLKPPEPKIKNITIKDKIKCVLCKRICSDINYHLRVFHKVGCVSSIIDQCEKIPTEYCAPDTIDKTSEICEQQSDNHVVSNDFPESVLPQPQPQPQPQSQLEPPLQSQLQQQPQVQHQSQMQFQSELQPELQTPLPKKKRRKNGPIWTIKKRKIIPTYASTSLYNSGPYKCNICLGIYKSYKSYLHHKKLHLMRGETPENFNPYTTRFLNSPFRNSKTPNKFEMPLNGDSSVKNEIPKSQAVLTNYFQIKEISSIAETVTENSTSQDTDFLSNEDTSESKTCECGRTFRKSHTLFLHKEKCKGINEDQSSLNNDTDSTLGISIKIKKNKNDFYEVVPSNTIEESCKEFKSSKDSDISSNDSGMASTDSNNHKIDSSEPSKYNHSILRIQVEDNDDEVDIEDDESSNQSNLNTDINTTLSISNSQVPNEVISSISKKSKFTESVNSGVRPITRRSNNVPSLTNLCKLILSKTRQQTQQLSTHKCQTCSMNFDNKNGLLEHLSVTKHGMISKCACGKTFKNLKYFNIHVKRVHPLLLKCNYCKINFERIEFYINHNCEVTEGQLFIEPIIQTQCLVCKELVDLEEPFDKHMKTHNNDTTYQCFKCDLRFENVNLRKAHFSKEHGFSLCQICGKLLHIEHSSKHDAYHEGLGYPCHICKKAFTQKILLKKHVQNIHDPLVNEFVKCLVCSKSMRLKYLKKHMSLHLHTEICRKCNKCYRSDEQKSLDDHVALDHPNDYPAQKCDICNTSFLSDKRYEEHLNGGSCLPNDNLNLVQGVKPN